MAAQRVIQLLRSNSVYNGFAKAKAALENATFMNTRKDGEIVLARYGAYNNTPTDETLSNGTVIGTAIGVYHIKSGNNVCTVFEDTSDLSSLISALQTELDNTQAGAGLGANGSYTAPVSGEDGFEILGGTNAPDDLREAIMKLADYVYDTLAGFDYSLNVNGTSDSATTLTKNSAAKVISAVNQTDGQIAAGTTDVKDLLLTGYTANASATGDPDATDTIESALNKLAVKAANGAAISAKSGNQITRVTGDATAANNGLYSHVEIAQLTAAEVTALNDANVREAYKLINPTDRTNIGDIIKIYKDSALQNAYIGHVDDTLQGEDSTTHQSASSTVVSGTGAPAICFVYQLANGNYQLVAVDSGAFLAENEFSDGLVVSNHIVSVNKGDGLDFDSSNPKKLVVKKDSNSEQVYTAASTAADVLTVSANGVKVANVQAAINYATNQLLSTTVTSSGEVLSNNTKHISISKTGPDATSGLYNYAVSETDIASETLVNAITGQTLGSSMSYSGTPSIIGQGASNTITSDLEALDTAVAGLQNGSVESVVGSNAININTTSPNDAQNPVVELKLDLNTVGVSGVISGADNALSITNDGLYLSNTIDCGTY